jgi:hypothetical protein
MARKRKKAVDDLSRPERRGPAGPSPLLVIAGLPEATALPAAATINNDGNSKWRAVTVAFARNDGAMYADDAAIVELGRLACGFAAQGARDARGVPMPSRIAVAYVCEPGLERLWNVFGHAVWPIPLHHPDWDYANGLHWRHSIEAVNLVIRSAIRAAAAEPIEAMRLRLEAHRSGDVLLLPGRNFHLDAERRLVERFRAFMSDALDVAGVEAGIRIERFAFERLRPFYLRVGGAGKRFAVDSRDIVFAKSNNGQHVVPANAQVTAGLVQRTLESRYRFGTPLVPDGYQHDAQLEEGTPFNAEPFDCVIKGPVQISGDHANVYPSDVVT